MPPDECLEIQSETGIKGCTEDFKNRAVKVSKASDRFDHLETQHLVIFL